MRGRSLVGVVVLSGSLAAQSAAPADPVSRLGEYVEAYYSRAQSIVTEETVVVQPLLGDLTADGFPRRAVYELRVEWMPDAANPDDRATAVRQLIKESGPSIYDKGEERCADPPLITPAPLAFLLPDNRPEWNFVIGRPQRVDGRQAMLIEYSLRETHPAKVMDPDCLHADVSGQILGRVYADSSTAEILRIDERLAREVDIKIPKEWQKRGRPTEVTIERLNSSVRYKRVSFTNPDEELLLPSSIETVQVHRSDSHASRLRITHSFTNYRRFVTDTRLVQ